MENRYDGDAIEDDANQQNEWREENNDGQWQSEVVEEEKTESYIEQSDRIYSGGDPDDEDEDEDDDDDDDDDNEDEDADEDWGDVDPLGGGSRGSDPMDPSGPGSAV